MVRELAYSVIDGVARRFGKLVRPTEKAERWALWWGYRRRPGPRICQLRSGPSLKLDPSDHLQLIIYYLGVFEPHCVAAMNDIVRAGDTVIDIGANIGAHTLELSKLVGERGRVLAVEAAPPNQKLLDDNIKLNGFANITVSKNALGPRAGEVRIALAEGANRGMFSVTSGPGTEAYVIPQVTLDELSAAQQLKNVSLVKLDVEGAEFGVLEGGRQLLASSKPAILIEINREALEQHGTSSNALCSLLEGLGYSGWVLSRAGRKPLQPETMGGCEECLFIHREKIAGVKLTV